VPALTAKISGDDKLIELIQLYRAHIDAICEECRKRDMDDEELDARMDRGNEILDEAIAIPAVTPVSAIAALDLVLEGDDGKYTVPDVHEEALLKTVRGYLVSMA
jgi:hypothetical protein